MLYIIQVMHSTVNYSAQVYYIHGGVVLITKVQAYMIELVQKVQTSKVK